MDQPINHDASKDSGDFMQALKEADADARMGFVRKVYSILAAMLFVTFGFTAVVKTVPSLNEGIYDMWYIAIPALMIEISIFCTLICCKHVARKTPTNYILLGIFTLCWTFLIGWICSAYDAGVVLMAAGMTAIITVSLSIYACFTKTDFTVLCGPFLCWGLLLIIAISMTLSLLSMIIFSFTETWYPFATGFAIIIYGLYLIIDTQLIVGGGRHSLSIDDYIIGAMILYMDIIYLFLKLLELFGRR